MDFHFQNETPFLEQHAELVDWLGEQSWSDFAQSLHRQATHKGSLSPKQLAAAMNMKAKCDAKRAEREAEKAGHEVKGHAALLAAFDRAGEHLKYPRITLGPLVITKAAEHSRNPGHLYIKLDGAYAGKVTPEGKLLARGLSPAEILRITDLLQDPESAARDYGKETGSCCMCNRELTNPDSIAAGIGPICASRWGL